MCIRDSWYTPVRPYERHDCCDRWISRWNNIGQVFFHQHHFLSTSKLLTPNMYCWPCKTLVTIYWTHLRVNGIWATSFCPEKMNDRTLFLLRDAFSGSITIFIVEKMMSQWRHHNKTHSCYSELNYVQNLYFGFFIFWKLTESCRFVTYLSDDPRMLQYFQPQYININRLWDVSYEILSLTVKWCCLKVKCQCHSNTVRHSEWVCERESYKNHSRYIPCQCFCVVAAVVLYCICTIQYNTNHNL